MSKDLDRPINKSVVAGVNNKNVQTYLRLIASNFSDKQKQIATDNAIKELLRSNFDVSDPTGTKKLNSQRLYQALWRTANRMKPLDFMIHGTGRMPHHEKIVTDGVSTILDRGGYDSALRDKNGVFYGMLTVGDKFLQVGANTNKKSICPLLFTPVDRSRVYLDNYCTGIRNRGQAGSAFRAVAIFSYSYQQICDMYPEYEKIGGVGKIPTESNDWNLDSRTWDQDVNLDQETEIAYAYNIIDGRENFTVFAGSACTVLEEFSGKEYPYFDNGEAYIPLLQYICVPSEDGPFNYGLGHLLYKLAIISSRLLNLELGHSEDNVYPITFVNTPQGEASAFFQKLAVAEKARGMGKKPYVALEYDPNNPGSSAISTQTMTTPSLVNEWQLIYNTLIDEIQMLGINLKELMPEGNPTATEILSDEENSNSWVKQTMEYNASETQKLLEITLSSIKKFVSVKSKIPLDLTTKIELEGEEIRADNINLGMVAKELKDHHYFVKVNSRTGAIPSNTMLRAKLMQTLQFLQPGSPAYAKATRQIASLNDIEFSMEDFGMPQPTAQGQPQEAMPIPSETDRMTFNPRVQEQAIAI